LWRWRINGTEFGSGTKYVYIRFKDEEGNLSPLEELAFDIIEYEMGELYSIKISPQEVTISLGSSYVFTLHGYDYGSKNEVPLDSAKVTWTKSCGVGSLSFTTGLSEAYPLLPGYQLFILLHPFPGNGILLHSIIILKLVLKLLL